MVFKLHLSSTNWLHDAFTSATGSFEQGMILIKLNHQRFSVTNILTSIRIEA